MANEFARHLRRNRTLAEKRLWVELRTLKTRGWKFRQQVPIDPYVVDFACLSHRLIIEVDGVTHSTPDDLAHDARRTAYLISQNFKVLRFWNDQMSVSLAEAMDQIVWALEAQERNGARPIKHELTSARSGVRAT